MVRLTPEEWARLKKAKQELQRRGYESVEPLEPYIEEEYEEKEETDLGEIIAGFALGAIVGLGAAALMKYLSDTAQRQKGMV